MHLNNYLGFVATLVAVNAGGGAPSGGNVAVNLCATV